MSPSLNRFKAKEPQTVLQRKPSEETLVPQEFLPKAALHLASSLSCDEKAVLAYLVLFGRNALLSSEASVSAVKSSWKPWKSSYARAGMRQQACPFYPLHDSTASSVLATEEGLPTKSPLPSSNSSKFKAGLVCDCFSCYASCWSRWDASPNRNVINEILEVVENCPLQGSKGKKKTKKKADKKQVVYEKSAQKDENACTERAPAGRDLVLNDDGLSSLASVNVNIEALVDNGVHTSIATEDVQSIIEEKNPTRRKKRLFRSMKQKEKPSVDPQSDGVRNGVSVGSSSIDGEADGQTAAVATDVMENLMLEAYPSMALGFPLPASECKSSHKPQQHCRLAKRRSNQVLPLDCESEDVLVVERVPETFIVTDNAHASISPTAADVGLGGRGLLDRVFPDTLGRVASRLWDLVSGRLRSRAVEYH